MNYTADTKPGMGDPYWYEWSVGLHYIIEMLNPDNGIESVELQADVALGLDDVVVTYDNGERLFVQVKHTRSNDTLTFGELVSKDKSSGQSLLHELATGWSKEKDKFNRSTVLLFTNRLAGTRKGTVHKDDSSFQRPSLTFFWPKLQKKVKSANCFEEISFPDYKDAWEEWAQQLESIKDDSSKLEFLKCLQIETNKSGLSDLQIELIQKLKVLFQTNDAIAESLLANLDHALRIWSTSNRDTPKINREEVFSKLSVAQESPSYNQDLIPSEPFFPSREELVKTLESELYSGQNKVVFLSGIAGTGKTNIISKLCAKKESLIDIRYYAYEPIDPTKEYSTNDVSRRVDKEYFWNELFNQLRQVLKGQLYKYNVPVINQLMTLEEKKRKFFEIVSKYADDRGKDFIIAIDGIDHAARATNIENTFLPTLPQPEYMPSNVKIILAGQPKENYRNYPDWLFSRSESVIEVIVPSLLSEDVQSLIDAKFFENDLVDRKQLCELISKYAQGNTLAVIFSVHEAMQEPELYKLEKKLKERKLSGNIHEYYRVIWKNAIERIQSLFVEYKVAGVFAFINEPINGKKLFDLFPQERLTESDWRNVLKELHPLLSEENGNYTILHNDVRVFLSSIIGQDQEHVQEVYSNLTDYYLALSVKNEAYYRDIFRFMKASGRLNEFERAFSPAFIIEAYVYGVNVDEIEDIILDILKEVLANTPIDWTKMRSLAFGYMTLDQIEKSQYEIESFSFHKRNNDIPIHPYECYVESLSKWHKSLVSSVLTLVKRLHETGLTGRANSLFKRWFSSMDVSEIYEKIESQEDKEILSPAAQNIAINLGAAICLSGEYSILEKSETLLKDHQTFVYYLIDSYIETMVREYSGDDIKKAVEKLRIVPYDSLLKGILEMLSDNRLSDIYIIGTSLTEPLKERAMGVLFTTFMEIISLKVEYSQERKEELWKQIEPIEFNGIGYENENAYYSMYALVAAFLQSRPSSIIAHEVFGKYLKKYPHRNKPYYEMYINNVCLIGEWLSQHQKCESISICPIELGKILHPLYIKKWAPNQSDYEIKKLRNLVLKAYIYLSKTARSEISKVVDDVCQKTFDSNPVNSLLDAGFYYYTDNNARQKQWYEYWLGNNGRVWEESIGERNRIIQQFIRVVRLYDTSKSIDITAAVENARWSVIGYSSHKEYTCNYLLKWYNSLVEKCGIADFTFSSQIKDISDKIEEIGDNRSEYILNCKVFGDLFSCDFETIKDNLHCNHYLSQCFESPVYLVDGLIGYLKDGLYDQTSLLKIWAIGMSVLDWKDEQNHASIHSLQRAIELSAERSGIHNIQTLLAKYGPAYINLAVDPVQYIIPERWCDESSEMKDVLVSESTILSYMDGDGISSDTITDCIEVLNSQGKITTQTLIELFKFELEKEEWQIEYNSIIACLFKTLPSSSINSIIQNHLDLLIENNPSFLKMHITAFVLWIVAQEDNSYAEKGFEDLLKMHTDWITSVGHFQEPEITESIDYTRFIEWESVTDIDSLFYQIIKILIMSEDADAARTALSGLFALERLDESFIKSVEIDWPFFHYRAKEWLLMTYELLWDLEKDRRDIVQQCIERHCGDDDFNVALYANLLSENHINDCNFTYIQSAQPFFSSIPCSGSQKLKRVPKDGAWVNGDIYVADALTNLTKLTGENYSDIEERTVAYSDIIENHFTLIPLNRYRIGGCRVTVDRIIISFLRVLYKDWIAGRWKGLEAQIARIILSASEPFALLVSPFLWKYNNSLLITDTNDFINLSQNKQNELLKKIIQTGIRDDEVILAGSIRDYTHNHEVFGFYLSYFCIPEMPSSYAAHKSERNSRYFLQRRADFMEYKHYNVTLHHNGVESFKDSNISCGLSKAAQMLFGWRILLSPDGFVLLNSEGNKIGHLECYYAYRSIGNRNLSNQPCLQRWIIKRKEFSEQLPWPICTVVDNVSEKIE